MIAVSHKTGITKLYCLSSKGLPKLSSFSASLRDNAKIRIKFRALISEDLSLEITPYQNRAVMSHKKKCNIEKIGPKTILNFQCPGATHVTSPTRISPWPFGPFCYHFLPIFNPFWLFWPVFVQFWPYWLFLTILTVFDPIDMDLWYWHHPWYLLRLMV